MKLRSTSVFVPAVLAGLVSLARAGDREVQCNPANPAQIAVEFLAAGPGGAPPTLPWRIGFGSAPGSDAVSSFAPGFPPSSCTGVAVARTIGAAAVACNTGARPPVGAGT